MAIKRRSKKRQTKFFGWLSLSLSVVFMIAAIVHDKGNISINDNFLPIKELNRMLSNDMSDFEDMKGLDKKIEKFLWKWHIKGASLAITRNDSLVYAKGYGWADQEMGIEMQPGHIMRVASVPLYPLP